MSRELQVDSPALAFLFLSRASSRVCKGEACISSVSDPFSSVHIIGSVCFSFLIFSPQLVCSLTLH
jgi:hypothetical protein